MVNKYIPKRGDIVWTSFSPQKGHEQAGTRPALVLTDVLFNTKTGLAFVAPFSSKFHGYSTEVEYNGSKICGSINAGQIKTIDWRERKIKYIETVNEFSLNEVQNIVISLIVAV